MPNSVLLSKALVRDHMRALGLSTIRFCGDPVTVDFFPRHRQALT